jgi:hypothetical protein
MRKKKPLPETAKDNSKEIVYFDPPWAQRKLPDAPAKDWSLPELHAAAVAAHAVIDPAESGFVTVHYWLLGRYLVIAQAKATSAAEFAAWKASLGIEATRLSRAASFAAAYKTKEAAAKATVKEAQDRVRELRAQAGKKPHGSRLNLTTKVTQAEQAVTAIAAGIGKVKDEKVLNVEIRRLRIIADELAKLLAKYGPKISAA